MKILTTNFLQCSIKSCNTFPLSYSVNDSTALQRTEQEQNPELLNSLLERLDWGALAQVCQQLGHPIPQTKPDEITQEILNDLHLLLMETEIVEGQIQCPKCEHIWYIKGGVANLLVPPHLAN
ncbi:RNA methylation protein [Martiniozyma asiatica (nom. inval.)]|nr:RNA methylation protein [Martiniozyma asiatica]